MPIQSIIQLKNNEINDLLLVLEEVMHWNEEKPMRLFLTVTFETNNFYRTVFRLRWNELSFIGGYEDCFHQ